jgi:hypothetical protein
VLHSKTKRYRSRGRTKYDGRFGASTYGQTWKEADEHMSNNCLDGANYPFCYIPPPHAPRYTPSQPPSAHLTLPKHLRTQGENQIRPRRARIRDPIRLRNRRALAIPTRKPPRLARKRIPRIRRNAIIQQLVVLVHRVPHDQLRHRRREEIRVDGEADAVSCRRGAEGLVCVRAGGGRGST